MGASMRRFGLVFLIVIAALAASFVTNPSPASPTSAGATVRIEVGGGHGSGVHIGDGYILTAAHVVDAEATVTVKLDTAEVRKGDVLWTNKAYDVALIRVASTRALAASPLSCRALPTGEEIYAIGNPMSMEFVTTWGRISGASGRVFNWHSAMPVTTPIGPGSSGGPIFDMQGRVVGLTVGAPLAPIGYGSSLMGIVYAVPSPAICTLLARSGI